jgi:hypothetical protein
MEALARRGYHAASAARVYNQAPVDQYPVLPGDQARQGYNFSNLPVQASSMAPAGAPTGPRVMENSSQYHHAMQGQHRRQQPVVQPPCMPQYTQQHLGQQPQPPVPSSQRRRQDHQPARQRRPPPQSSPTPAGDTQASNERLSGRERIMLEVDYDYEWEEYVKAPAEKRRH